MRVLYIIDSLGTGGAERSSLELWYFLRANNVDLKILVIRHRNEGIEEQTLSSGFNVTFMRGSNILSQSFEIARIVRQFRPDLVHSVLFKSNIRTRIARLFTRFVNIESLVNCSYDVIRLKDPNVSRTAFLFYKKLDRYTAFLVDHFHAITNVVKEHYAEVLKIDREKISVIYRGRSGNDAIMVERSELGADSSTFLIVNTGRHEYQKGQIVLIDAIRQLLLLEVKKVKLVIFGRDGATTKQMKEYVAANGLQNYVNFAGHRGDIPACLKAADLFAFSSFYEGLGGALIEAQAAGLPVVCSDLPVLKEVVREGQNALLFRTGDASDAATKIRSLILDRPRLQRMSQESLDNFKRLFTLQGINSQMLELYRKQCTR